MFSTNNNEIFFDPGGGGHYDYLNNKVEGGGHVWFPLYENVFVGALCMMNAPRKSQKAQGPMRGIAL